VSSEIYDIARFKMMTAAFGWTAFDLMLVAFSGVAVFDASDDTLTDVLTHGALDAGHSLTIVGKNVLTNGTGQTGPVVIPAVVAGPPITHFVMFDKQGVVANSVPLFFTSDAEQLPFTPNGLDIVVQPDWLLERGWLQP
jgi:hypothetical protein